MTKEKLLKKIKKNEVKIEPKKELTPEEKSKLQTEIQRMQKEWEQTHKPRELKIAWYSEAPFIRTREGTLTNYISQGFMFLGFPTVDIAYYGIQPGGYIKFDKIVVLPVEKTNKDPTGVNDTKTHVEKFGLDVIFYHADSLLTKLTEILPKKVYGYLPIDMINYPVEVVKALERFEGIIVPSLFGQKELKRYGIKSTYIPPGINPRIFTKMDKKACRKFLNLPIKHFIIGMVGSNQDKEPTNGWDAMFEAISLFFKKNPKAKKRTTIFIHTRAIDNDGLNLPLLARQFGIQNNIIWQDSHLIKLGVPEQVLSRMYGAFDILFNLSGREGVGLQILEAGAVGVPSIVTGFGCMPERVNNGKCGWIVKPLRLKITALTSKIAIPDPTAAAVALTEAYTNKKKLGKKSKKALEFAKQFSWFVIMDQKWQPYLEQIENEIILKKELLKQKKEIKKIPLKKSE